MANQVLKPRFRLGQVVMTVGVKEHCGQLEFDQFWKQSLNRHMIDDWGDLCPQDRQENETSIKEGYRLLSAYGPKICPKIWIITEA